MRRSLIVISLLLIWGTAQFGLSQTVSVTPHKSSVVHSEKGAIHSATHVFNQQLLKVVKTIAKDEKSKKLTASQAQGLMEQVKAIRVQELQFMKQSENKSLTSGQIQQLTGQLNSLKSLI